MVGALLFVVLISAGYWGFAILVSSTTSVPDHGGTYTEGIVGQPRFVNPVLSLPNSPDDALSRVVYAGLFGYDSDGRIKNDLAEHYSISDDRQEYVVTLRNGLTFHDGTPVSSQDVAFTVNAIKDPAYRSPLRQNWQGVDVEVRDERTVAFKLKKPYFGFLEHLTVGILPKHIWDTIAPDRFALADPNLAPVGAGPYRFFDFKKDANGNILSYELRAFPGYFDGEPYITKLAFHFYGSDEEMIDALGKRQIMGTSPLSPEQATPFFEKKGISVRGFHLPRVFGVFFNTTKSVPLAYAEVREAVSKATDREALVAETLMGKGVPTPSPFLPFMQGSPNADSSSFDPEAAARILDEKGWKLGDDGVRSKENVRLSFPLLVPDWSELRKTADILRQQWLRAGISADVTVLPINEFNQEILRKREYEAILYGEEMSVNPDFFSFWHSSGSKEDTGLNLAVFKDDAADELLLKLREESDPGKRDELLRDFLNILSEKYPAVFLYSPDAFCVTDDSIKGWDLKTAGSAAGRMSGIGKWYIETKRVLK